MSITGKDWKDGKINLTLSTTQPFIFSGSIRLYSFNELAFASIPLKIKICGLETLSLVNDKTKELHLMIDGKKKTKLKSFYSDEFKVDDAQCPVLNYTLSDLNGTELSQPRTELVFI